MISGAYRAPRWLRGGHAQTIYPALFLRGERPRYRNTDDYWTRASSKPVLAGGAFPGNLDWLPKRLLAFFGEHLL